MPLQTINSSLSLSSSAEKAPRNAEKAASSPNENAQTPPAQQVTPQQKLNIAILQAHQDVSISTKNEPLALIYKAAIEGINKELKTELGENAIENAYESDLDVSPEATADRILSFSIGLFPLYQQQRPELSEPEQAEQFAKIIGGGIDTGFSEAREILDGLGVLEGDIADNINKTYTIIQEELAAFREKYLPPPEIA
jgi:hypothetical protein